MVVPEAHLVNEEKYHQVYVVTSQSPSCPSQQIEDFFSTRESVQLFFHRVEGFNNLEKMKNTKTFPKHSFGYTWKPARHPQMDASMFA